MPLFALGGCSSLQDFFGTAPGKREELVVVPIDQRPVQEPVSANHFVLDSEQQSVVGVPQIMFTRASDTLADVARAYGLGYDELIDADPEVNPWLPGENTPVLLPTQFVLPDVPREGIVLNIASRRLFYFPELEEGQARIVKTFPIGIGRVGWETPLGLTQVVAKAKDPHWYVPLSVRKEHAEMGNPLPSVVPPGPDNPLGHRVLKLEMPGYLIHGTNQPFGVGMRVSHGCVRLYPENIEYLYPLVSVGENVVIVNEPYQMGRHDGVLYFEAHPPLEDDTVPAEARLQTLFDTHVDADGRPLNNHLQDHIRSLADQASGMPVSIVMYDANEYVARARVVHNTVEMDPNAPTLLEVHEMMDEVAAEIEAESM